jgi:WhiB family transcriptional regulator, redox-sensing transcriptional regulator
VLPVGARAGSLDWMSQGACQREDPELFFPITTTGPALQQVSAAKAVCRRCIVAANCLSYALDSMQDGVWGGTTAEERRAMRETQRWHTAELSAGAVSPAVDTEPRAMAAQAARPQATPAGAP